LAHISVGKLAYHLRRVLPRDRDTKPIGSLQGPRKATLLFQDLYVKDFNPYSLRYAILAS